MGTYDLFTRLDDGRRFFLPLNMTPPLLLEARVASPSTPPRLHMPRAWEEMHMRDRAFIVVGDVVELKQNLSHETDVLALSPRKNHNRRVGK